VRIAAQVVRRTCSGPAKGCLQSTTQSNRQSGAR
jgi:hypothetical protein